MGMLTAVRYDPAVHHRRSLRLPGYDYTAAGYYYVTICTCHREIVMDRQAVREAVEGVWRDLPKRFAGTDIDEFIVMPNHIHGIVVFRDSNGASLADVMRAFKSLSAIRANRLLGRAGRPFWQRNYFERVVRNDRELDTVREYIRSNPLNWDVDPQNPERRRSA